MNAFDAMREAINSARQIHNAARRNTCGMARFLPGNLDTCDHSTLVKLKKELARYNIHTRRWRDAK